MKMKMTKMSANQRRSMGWSMVSNTALKSRGEKESGCTMVSNAVVAVKQLYQSGLSGMSRSVRRLMSIVIWWCQDVRLDALKNNLQWGKLKLVPELRRTMSIILRSVLPVSCRHILCVCVCSLLFLLFFYGRQWVLLVKSLAVLLILCPVSQYVMLNHLCK